MKQRNTAFCLLVVMICSLINPIVGEGFLPSLDKAFGISMPLVSKIIEHGPLESRTNEDGTTVEEYTDVSYDEYTAIGRCFMSSGFSLTNKSFNKGIIQLELQKENQAVSALYDITGNSFKIIIPEYYTEDLESYHSENEQSIFPDVEEMAGTILPRLSAALMREPDAIKDDSDKYSEEYREFGEDDYKLISSYLLQKGCEVRDYTKEGNTLTINLKKKDDTFKLIYDPDGHKATMEYDKSSNVEPMVTNTPKPTQTPKPTNTPKPTKTSAASFPPEQYNAYASIYVLYLKMISDRPDSLKVHSIDVMKYKGELYLVVDYTGYNNSGQFYRVRISFRLIQGSILSTDEDFAAFGLYEEHKNEFLLVKHLDINEVMKLVNK